MNETGMNDTVKIKRPMFCRRQEDIGGRIKADHSGNAVRVRTRVYDSQDDLGGLSEPELQPRDDPPGS